MSDPVLDTNRAGASPAETLYRLGMRGRAAWFAAQYLMAARLSPKTDFPADDRPAASWADINADLNALFKRDWDNIAAGLYPAPADTLPNPAVALPSAVRFLRDLPRVNRRRAEKRGGDVFAEPYKGKYPRYYLQNFHYQSGGYLTEASAALYDHQVEVLFTGGADAMRRQALPGLVEALRRTDARRARHVDIACGTGRFLRDLKRAYPALRAVGVDLSRAYLAKADRLTRPWGRRARFAQAKAEALPLADASMDTASCIYLFHELPRKIRPLVAAEAFRVLKPGGRLVFVDSIQEGDHAPYDPLLARFPAAFHEPYYADYVKSDLGALFRAAGFIVRSVERAFFSRVMVLDKPAS